MKILWCFLLLSFAYLTGCDTAYHYAQPDPTTGELPSSHKITKEEIPINKSITLSDYKRLLVVALTRSDQESSEFWVQSISNMHYFDHVIALGNLSDFLVKEGYGDYAPEGLYDLVTLHTLQKVYGDFLVLKITKWGSNQVVFSIIDPASGQTQLQIKRAATAFAGLSPNLFNPILNAFHEWIKKNSQSN